MGAYNTVPEAARGVLSYVQRQCAELEAARAEIEQLCAVADTARDIVREGGRPDLMNILELCRAPLDLVRPSFVLSGVSRVMGTHRRSRRGARVVRSGL